MRHRPRDQETPAIAFPTRCDGNTVGILCDVGTGGVEPHCVGRECTHVREQNARKHRLFALQAIGMRSCIGEQTEVEYRPFADFMHPDLPAWARQTGLDQRAVHAERREEIEGGRMKRRRSKVVGQTALALKHDNLDPGPQQQQCDRQPDRPGSHDDHPIAA